MINILLHGCNGKMGRAISEKVSSISDMRIICGVDTAERSDADYPVFTEFEDVPENMQVDVMIDFSHFSALSNVIRFAKLRGIPSVIATTGFSEEQVNAVKELSEKVPVFRSANMSVGVSLLKKLACRAAEFLGEDFDIEILEKHHNQKIDAPSGTALAIADAINDSQNKKFHYVTDRASKREKRSSTEIGISSIRGGNIVGDHDVIFAGNNEIIEINHRALSRGIFADGAIRAARYIQKKPAGLYDMDMLVEETE